MSLVPTGSPRISHAQVKPGWAGNDLAAWRAVHLPCAVPAYLGEAGGEEGATSGLRERRKAGIPRGVLPKLRP